MLFIVHPVGYTPETT